MSSHTILHEVVLEKHNHPTGKTKHFFGATLIGKPYMLQIVRFLGERGYNLVHLAENRGELTNTYHDSVDSAMNQAHWEFTVSRSQWTFVNQHHIDESGDHSMRDVMLERIRQKLKSRSSNSHSPMKPED
ncbi:MAG: hypothetical protein ACPGVO_14110 [Spirulinaceae cyanobacterium]